MGRPDAVLKSCSLRHTRPHNHAPCATKAASFFPFGVYFVRAWRVSWLQKWADTCCLYFILTRHISIEQELFEQRQFLTCFLPLLTQPCSLFLWALFFFAFVCCRRCFIRTCSTFLLLATVHSHFSAGIFHSSVLLLSHFYANSVAAYIFFCVSATTTFLSFCRSARSLGRVCAQK